jgi:DNA-binding winged helix-turn-helix (wHTH) protein
MTGRYRFDDVQIDVQGFRLLKAAQVVPVEPKALNLLVFLVENPGRLIERQELMNAVWGDAFVTDHVLNRAIGQLRKLLADDAKQPRYIETVPTLGYRFVAGVERDELETPASSSLAPSVPSPVQLTPSGLPRWATAALVITLVAAVGGTAFWLAGRRNR